MRIEALALLGIVAVCAACDGTPNNTSGAGGGDGGSGGTGGSTTSTTTGTGTGGTGGAGGCPAPAANVYDNSSETGVPACDHPIGPLPEEDGTFAVTVFGPFATPFQLDGFEFGASDGDTTTPTDPWTAAVIVVPAGSDPLAVNPSDAAKPYPLTLIEKLTADNGTANRYSIQLDAPLPVDACDMVVVALRNTVGPPLSGLEMCGTGGSTHPETNQWWNLNDTMSQMDSYGDPYLDADWWVSLLPAAPN